MNAWLFDVDGVITNLATRKVEYPQIIQKIVEKLQNNEPVGIITGRALPWLYNGVLSEIEDQTKPQGLSNLFASPEFGAITIDYAEGKRVENIDKTLLIPSSLINACRSIVGSYKDVFYVDEEKITHFTLAVHKGIDESVFKTKQIELVEKLSELVIKLGFGDEIEVHHDSIAINVKNKKLNKHLATQKLLIWLKGKNSNPELFFVFGDSKSDLEMGEELFNQGKKFTFVYVGEGEIKQKPFEVVRTTRLYDEGTLEYLTSNIT